MAEQQFVFDDLARVVRAPYWACSCGTLLHPTAGATESERRAQPRCEQCSAHGRSPQMRQVVVSIEHEGWGA